MVKLKLFFPYILSGLVFYFALSGIVGYFFYDRYLDHRELYTQHQLETSALEFESLKAAYDTIADTTFQVSINTPDITKMMADAAQGDEQTRIQTRERMYQKLKPLYALLEENNLRQLHFHLPGSISFLRFHRPDQYGDSLKGIRPSVDAVHDSHRKVSGFEEGRIFNGFRHVFPLFHEGAFVGSVELSYSFDAIRELASHLYPTQYEMILKKEVVNETVFAHERSNYRSSLLSPLYVHDQSLKPLAHPLYPPSLIETIDRALSQSPELRLGEPYTYLIPLKIADDGYIVAFNPLYSFDSKLAGYIISYESNNHYLKLHANMVSTMVMIGVLNGLVTLILLYFIYRIRKQKKLLLEMANTDKLTGAFNRSYLISHLGHLAHAARRQRRPLSLIFLDIDHFKQINDTYGHGVGDTVLIELSRLFKTRIRESDILSRWGGEEFIIALPDANLQEAASVAEALRRLVENHPFAHARVTCSFGVAQWIENEAYQKWIERADKKLYEAKESGRNRVSA